MPFRIDFIDETVIVDATPREVGDLLEDVEGWPRWSRGVSRGFRRGADPTWRRGLMIGFVPRFLRVPVIAPVVEYERDRCLYWGAHTRLAKMVHGFSIDAMPGGRSRVRHTEYASGVLGVAARPLRRAVTRFDREWTEDLVAHFARRA